MIPKYEQIKLDLLSQIKQHQFVPGDKFYSESDIKKKYDVSSITAVKALNQLTNAGYLYRIQGKGTFVSKSKVAQNVKFSDIENHPFNTENVAVISVTEEHDSDILKELGLLKTDSYYKIVRVRSVDDTPLLVHMTHLTKKMMKEPISKDLTLYDSIYDRIRIDFGIDLYTLSSLETNEIIFPDNAELLNLLHLSFREPAVKQIKYSYLPDKSVAEYIISYKHWKFFKTKIEVEAE